MLRSGRKGWGRGLDSIRNKSRALCFAVLIAATGAVGAAEPGLCTALRDRAQDFGSVGEILEVVPVDGPEWNGRVPNVDLDGDGASDSILLSRSESPSRFPADSTEVRIALSATGKTYPAAFPHVALRRYRGQVYLVGTTYADDTASARLDVHVLDRKGITQRCSVTVPVR